MNDGIWNDNSMEYDFQLHVNNWLTCNPLNRSWDTVLTTAKKKGTLFNRLRKAWHAFFDNDGEWW